MDFPKDTSYFVIAERGTLIGGILWEGTRFDGRKLISYDDWLDVLKCRGVLSIEEFTSHKVTTLEELLKEDIPKSTAWFALRIREGAMYAVLTEIRVTEGTIISYYEWEDLLKEIRLSEIPEVRKHPVVECMTW